MGELNIELAVNANLSLFQGETTRRKLKQMLFDSYRTGRGCKPREGMTLEMTLPPGIFSRERLVLLVKYRLNGMRALQSFEVVKLLPTEA